MKEFIKYSHTQKISNNDTGFGEAIILFLIAFIILIPFGSYNSTALIPIYLGLTTPLLISFSKNGYNKKVDLYDQYPINYKRRVLYNLIQSLKGFLVILSLITLIIFFASLFDMRSYNSFIQSFKNNIPFKITTHFIATILSFNMFTFTIGFIRNRKRRSATISTGALIFLLINTVIASINHNSFSPLGVFDYNNISTELNIFVLIVTILKFISIFMFYIVALYLNKPKQEVNLT